MSPPWNVLPDPNNPSNKENVLKLMQTSDILKLKEDSVEAYALWRAPFRQHVHTTTLSGSTKAFLLRAALTGGPCESYLRSANDTYEDYCLTLRSLESSFGGDKRFYDFYLKQARDLPVCTLLSLDSYKQMLRVCDALMVATNNVSFRQFRNSYDIGETLQAKLSYEVNERRHDWLRQTNKPLEFNLSHFCAWLREIKIPSLEQEFDRKGGRRTTAVGQLAAGGAMRSPAVALGTAAHVPSTPRSPWPPQKPGPPPTPAPFPRQSNGAAAVGNGGGSARGNGAHPGGVCNGHGHGRNQTFIQQTDGNDTLTDADSQTMEVFTWRGFYTRNAPAARQRDPCFLCKADHLLIECQRFLAMTPKERLLAIVAEARCTACLRPNHKASGTTCKARGCKDCGGKHHRLLHGSHPDHKLAAKAYAMLTSGVELEEDPFVEDGIYLQQVFGDEIDFTMPDYSGHDSVQFLEADPAAVDPSSMPTTGEVFQGPATQAMFAARTNVMEDDLSNVNEALYRYFPAPPSLARRH
jgi:hypothetical protein